MEPRIFACRAAGMPQGWMQDWYGIVGGEKAARLRRMPEAKAALSLTGELLARYALWEAFGVDVRQLRFSVEASGKPVVESPRGYYFNISHSGEWCVCAVAEAPVGIDVQIQQPVRFEAIAKRWFSPEEQQQLAQADDTKAMFYTLWTKREAVGKCMGVGLRPLPVPLPPMQLRWKTLGNYRVCVCWEECAKD